VPHGEPAPSRILPDGGVDLLWRTGRLLVAGPDRDAFLSPVAGETIVGLRLLPGVAGPVLGFPASELLGLRVPLGDVWHLDGLDERLATLEPPASRRAELERALLERRAEIGSPDPLVRAATDRLGVPAARVGPLSDELGTSERQLRRRFHDAVGYGPKTLDRILRFQRFVARARALAAGEEELARVAAELGYADQAHLSRDCSRLSGLTPRDLVAEAASAGGGPFTA
jgi:AraC-like DNA-binding protein